MAYLEREEHNNILNYKLCDEHKSSFDTIGILEIYCI